MREKHSVGAATLLDSNEFDTQTRFGDALPDPHTCETRYSHEREKDDARACSCQAEHFRDQDTINCCLAQR